jgi:hypothetical protein
MSTSISDLLKQRPNTEPPEITLIKAFVRDEFDASCTVQMQTNLIIISVASASLAGSLRMRLHELQEQLETKKRLMIRIS